MKILSPEQSESVPVTIGVIDKMTLTVSVTGGLEQFPPDTTSVYVPELAAEAFGITGFCKDEENPFGPVHE